MSLNETPHENFLRTPLLATYSIAITITHRLNKITITITPKVIMITITIILPWNILRQKTKPFPWFDIAEATFRLYMLCSNAKNNHKSRGSKPGVHVPLGVHLPM